jgi:hypothetical protein
MVIQNWKHMEFTPEDNLRLNVLLANNLQAIRIDESKMIIYGLSDKGEAKIQLHPNCRDEIYLRKIREFISGHVLGSPGGYPVYLKRWNRMGQSKNDNLDQLLMLGEPEAVVEVVHAPSLTSELARRAWWAMPDADNARSLLKNSEVANSELAKELATYLVEYLPFETESYNIIQSVYLVLQANLIDEATREKLWKRKKNANLVGFLIAQPDDLPEPVPARASYEEIKSKLEPLIAEGNQVAKLLLKISSSSGQTFLNTCERVLGKPANQDIVNLLFDVIALYFKSICPNEYNDEMDISILIEQANNIESIEIQQVLSIMPNLSDSIQAMLILAGLRYSILSPIFSHTTAIGSLMRKKLAPVLEPLFEQIVILRN